MTDCYTLRAGDEAKGVGGGPIELKEVEGAIEDNDDVLC